MNFFHQGVFGLLTALSFSPPNPSFRIPFSNIAQVPQLLDIPSQFQSTTGFPSGIPDILHVDTVVAVMDDSQLKSFVYPVNTQAGSGTCVVVGKIRNTYYALTAAHVVKEDSVKGGFSVIINGVNYVASKVPAFVYKGIDLAIISFNYSGNLPLAVMHSNLSNALKSEVSFEIPGYENISPSNSTVTVAGYSMSSDAIDRPVFRKMTVSLQDRIKSNQNGYELAYPAATFPGMSGGGIFAWVINSRSNWKEYSKGIKPIHRPSFPILIGIHGKSEGYLGAGRSGISLGIPVDIIANQTKNESVRMGIPNAISTILAALDGYKNVCWLPLKMNMSTGKFLCEQ